MRNRTRLDGSGFYFIQILYERFDTAFIVEMIFTVVTFVAQTNRHAGVQEGELTQALSQNIVLEFGMVRERLQAWPETYGGTGNFSITNHFQRELGNTVRVGLLVNFTFTANNQFQFSDRALTTETPTPCKPPETL